MIKNIDDTELKQLLKKELPKAPENPWFTRKVMNRLPEKEFKVFFPVIWAISFMGRSSI